MISKEYLTRFPIVFFSSKHQKNNSKHLKKFRFVYKQERTKGTENDDEVLFCNSKDRKDVKPF